MYEVRELWERSRTAGVRILPTDHVDFQQFPHAVVSVAVLKGGRPLRLDQVNLRAVIRPGGELQLADLDVEGEETGVDAAGTLEDDRCAPTNQPGACNLCGDVLVTLEVSIDAEKVKQNNRRYGSN